MDASQIYIAASIAVLAIIAVLVFVVKRNAKEKRLTPLAGLAFGFILAGIVFGGERLIGYGLLGVGVVFAVIDIFKQLGASKRSESTSLSSR
jgi:hypothetical protein